jgi:hypothetical protein
VKARARFVGVHVRIGNNLGEQRIVDRLEKLAAAMHQLVEGAARDGDVEPVELLLDAIGRCCVGARGDDQIGEQTRTELRPVDETRSGRTNRFQNPGLEVL